MSKLRICSPVEGGTPVPGCRHIVDLGSGLAWVDDRRHRAGTTRCTRHLADGTGCVVVAGVSRRRPLQYAAADVRGTAHADRAVIELVVPTGPISGARRYIYVVALLEVALAQQQLQCVWSTLEVGGCSAIFQLHHRDVEVACLMPQAWNPIAEVRTGGHPQRDPCAVSGTVGILSGNTGYIERHRVPAPGSCQRGDASKHLCR